MESILHYLVPESPTRDIELSCGSLSWTQLGSGCLFILKQPTFLDLITDLVAGRLRVRLGTHAPRSPPTRSVVDICGESLAS